MYKNILFVLAISIGILLPGACREEQGPIEIDSHQGKKVSDTPSLPTVQVVRPENRDFKGEFTVTGTAMADKQVTVSALEAGRVDRVLVDIGQWVRRGQTLAVLKNPMINRQYEMVKVKLDFAQRDYERLRALNDKTPDLISIRNVEQAEAIFKTLEAQLHAVSDRMLYLKVRAPFNGVVTKRYVDPGAMVQNALEQREATPIVDILDASVIRLTVYLPEADVAYISKGTSVDVSFPELGDALYHAKVSRTSKSLDPVSNTMTVEIDLDNKEGKLKPGMFARVHFELRTQKEVLALPLSTLVLKQDASYVYVVKANVAHLVEVKKGLEDQTSFQVLSGVQAGDQVVVKGKNTISDGRKVQIVQ